LLLVFQVLYIVEVVNRKYTELINRAKTLDGRKFSSLRALMGKLLIFCCH